MIKSIKAQCKLLTCDWYLIPAGQTWGGDRVWPSWPAVLLWRCHPHHLLLWADQGEGGQQRSQHVERVHYVYRVQLVHHVHHVHQQCSKANSCSSSMDSLRAWLFGPGWFPGVFQNFLFLVLVWKKTSTDEGPFHPQTWVCPDSETTRLLRRFKQTSDICLRKRSFDAIQTNEILRMEEKHTYNYHFAGIKAQIKSKLLKNIVWVFIQTLYVNCKLTNVAPRRCRRDRSTLPRCLFLASSFSCSRLRCRHHHYYHRHHNHHLYHRPQIE